MPKIDPSIQVELTTEYLFQIYDEDQNGYLDSNELNNMMDKVWPDLLQAFGEDLRKTFPKEALDQAVKEMDLNEDGKVSQEEFKLAIGPIIMASQMEDEDYYDEDEEGNEDNENQEGEEMQGDEDVAEVGSADEDQEEQE